MALAGFPIPPWLVTRPEEHSQASAQGLNAGLQAAHIWAAAAQEQARLQESQRAQDMDNALKQEALQQKSIYDAQALAVDKAKNQAVASLAQAKLQDTQQKAEQAAQQWAQEFALNQKKADVLAQHYQAMDTAKETPKPRYFNSKGNIIKLDPTTGEATPVYQPPQSEDDLTSLLKGGKSSPPTSSAGIKVLSVRPAGTGAPAPTRATGESQSPETPPSSASPDAKVLSDKLKSLQPALRKPIFESLGDQIAARIGPSPDIQQLQIGSSTLKHSPGEIYSQALIDGESTLLPGMKRENVVQYLDSLPPDQVAQMLDKAFKDADQSTE